MVHGIEPMVLLLKMLMVINDWYLNGELHRTDGPAVEYANGNKYWYLNGKFHRTDGPALNMLMVVNVGV